jgi:hypothetical protein
MKAPGFLKTLDDRFFRAAALREEQARATLTVSRRAALDQAILTLEIARRTATPVEALPTGARPAALLALYRQAAYWALVARRPEVDPPPADLREAWDELPAETLLAVVPDARTLAAVRHALLDVSPASLVVSAGDIEPASGFVEAIVAALDAPRGRVERIRGQRWARILAACIVLGFCVYGLRVLSLGPNLAANRPFRTSSTWPGCPADPNCVPLAFCTDPQDNPWAELDLGKPTRFRRIEIANRTDCCGERAVPLIVEVSDDAVHYREIARRTEEFSSWTVKFAPLTARYVRFKVPRSTVFHLQRVAIR